MSEQHKKNEKNFLIQGSILAIAGVITKLIGAFYRIPLLNIIGTEGNGYYSVAFSIYSVAFDADFVQSAVSCVKACIGKSGCRRI